MHEQEIFGLLGGDSRQAALAASLAQDGHSVFAWGLEGLPAIPGVQNVTPEDVVTHASSILLPLPVSKDGRHLNAPFAAGSPPELDGAFWRSLHGKKIFGGQLSRVKTPCPEDLAAHDYAAREEFAIRNACLTAEGQLKLRCMNPNARLPAVHAWWRDMAASGARLRSFCGQWVRV